MFIKQVHLVLLVLFIYFFFSKQFIQDNSWQNKVLNFRDTLVVGVAPEIILLNTLAC